MRKFAFLPRICLVAVAAFAIVACSNTAGAIDDEDESSSSAKVKSSSSVADVENEGNTSSSIADDCVGEAGNPWDGTTAKEFACGTGTKLDPYVILTGEQLAHLSFVIGAKNSDYMGKYYKLGADIRLNDGEIINENGALVADSTKLYKWTPIGNSSVAFDGYFDGNGHTVGGMFINTTSTHNGLFGSVSGEIKNVTVDDSWVTGGKYTAGIVGLNEKGILHNLINKSSVIGVGEFTGGIVGSCQSTTSGHETEISSSFNYGVVIGKNSTGGIAGQAFYAQIDTVKNYGYVEGLNYVGGIIGKVGYSMVSTYYISAQSLENYGEVIGAKYTGGLVGLCGTNSSCSTSDYALKCGTVDGAGNYGKVTGQDYTGGLMGYVCQGPVKRAVNEANIEGTSYVAGLFGYSAYATTTSLVNRGVIAGNIKVGGISGHNQEGVTSSAYNVGKVTGDSLVGLMIGYNYNATMADYYYLEQGEQEPFGKNDGGGVATPKSANEMKSEDFAELLGDDFIYDDGVNDGWPSLGWERE